MVLTIYFLCCIMDSQSNEGGDYMRIKTSAERESKRQDIYCLYTELLKDATVEQKEKALIAATAFLMGAAEKQPKRKSI